MSAPFPFHSGSSRSTPNFSRVLDFSPATTSPSTRNLRGQIKKKTALESIKAFFTKKSKTAPMPPPIGLWRCCQCGKGHELFVAQGQHLLAAVSCDCPHHSCEECALSGDTKAYKPVQEPIPIQLSDATKRILFGVFCSDCGTSWKARTVSDIVGSQTMRQKVSAVPKSLVQHGAHPLGKLRASRSMANLLGSSASTSPSLKAYKSTYNLRALSNEMEKQHGTQADTVLVEFSGINCTCGRTLDSSDLCFQIVEQPENNHVDELACQCGPEPGVVSEEPEVTSKQPVSTATPEDIAKGHDTPMLMFTVQGNAIRHASPLRSNPVTVEGLAYLYG